MKQEEALRILELDKTLDWTDIDLAKAYKSACKAAHPDAGGSATAFHDVKQAYDLLKGVARRASPASRRTTCPNCSGVGKVRQSSGKLGSEGLLIRCKACNGSGVFTN